MTRRALKTDSVVMSVVAPDERVNAVLRLKNKKGGKPMMNIFDEIVEIGKSILTKQHKFVPYSELDDLSHISEMKIVIEGIAEYLSSKDYSENDIMRARKILIQFAEKNFLEQCAKAATDVGDTSDEEVDKEYFAYIYNTGEYPE